MARNSFGRNSGNDRMMLFFFAFMFFIFLVVIVVFLYWNMNSNGEAPENSFNTDQTTVYNNEQVDVLVPINEIPARAPLNNSMFEKVKRNALDVDSRAIKEYSLITNMYARTVLAAGVPFLKEQITNIRPTSSVSTSIPDGYRAVTIQVDAVSGVEGWARPGSIVDVYWTFMNNGNDTINIIVQGAKVLSAAGDVSNDINEAQQNIGTNPPSTVTLLVTAEGAQRILLAQSSGKLSLSLRGDNDTGSDGSAVKPISINDIRGSGRNVINAIKPVQQRSVGTMKIDGQEYTINERGEIRPIVDEDF